MQKSLHFSAIRKPGLMALFVAAWLAGLAPSWGAPSYTSDWSDAGDAKVRLLAAGKGPVDGAYRAVVEMQLAPGWLTYWREPRDAGVPPVFSFAASQNMTKVAVGFPAPERITEAGGTAFGYHTAVDLTLTVTPRDPSHPVLLDMALDYAICERICVPAKAHARLELAPAAAGPHDPRIAADFASLPVRLAPEAAARSYRLEAGPAAKTPSWRLSWIDAATAPDDLFVEAPEGWFFTSRPSDRPHEFVISAVEVPKDAKSVDILATTRGSGGSREVPVHLMLPN